MTDKEETAIRCAATKHHDASMRMHGLRMRNIAGLTPEEARQAAMDYAVAQALEQEAWVILRKAQGFAS